MGVCKARPHAIATEVSQDGGLGERTPSAGPITRKRQYRTEHRSSHSDSLFATTYALMTEPFDRVTDRSQEPGTLNRGAEHLERPDS